MSLHLSVCIVFLFITTCFTTIIAQETPFDQNYIEDWGYDHIIVQGQGAQLQITIDEHGGGGARSKQPYTYGIFAQKMKMPKNSSGIVTAFYLMSIPDFGAPGDHDEIDFELLGGDKYPYRLSTNIYNKDDGHREQGFDLWFNPTKHFHEYKLIWNKYQIVFFVDDIPIRIFKNLSNVGVKYPTLPMWAHSSLWNSPQWLGPVNWKNGPFIAKFREFGIEGCLDATISECESEKYGWNLPQYKELNPQQQKMYEEKRKTNLKYDYCALPDNIRKFPECKYAS